MAQLLNKGINTVNFTNSILRNEKKLDDYIILRNEGVNTPFFSMLSIFKDLILDIGRQVSAEYINDICIMKVQQGKSINLNEVENRLILCLENSSIFSYNDKRFTPDTGDLIWTNDNISIINSSDAVTFLLVIDFKEFLL